MGGKWERGSVDGLYCKKIIQVEEYLVRHLWVQYHAEKLFTQNNSY